MPAYGPEPEANGGRQRGILAATFLILALSTSYLPASVQQRIAWSMRVTMLVPFLATQDRLTGAQLNARDVGDLMRQLDSMTALSSTRAVLVEENRDLRALLGLADRAEPSFLPATVLRPGTQGSERFFFVDVGRAHGIYEGASVVTQDGLVGKILDVREEISSGMDWTHPDFSASAMLQDGSMFGLVENRPGDFREVDRLVFDGTAYNEEALPGTVVLTSGFGGVYPQGIPIGVVDEVEDTQGGWRKSYYLRAMVQPGSVRHVLVTRRPAEADVSALWLADSLQAMEPASGEGRRP